MNTLALTSPPPNTVEPSAHVNGTPGNQQFYYWVVAHYPIGTMISATPMFVGNAPTALDGDNNVLIFWDNIEGVLTYDVIRSTNPIFPSTAGNFAIALGLTSSPVTDSLSTPNEFDPATLPGLPHGSPVTLTITLNNRDYPQPTLVLPGETSVGTLVFADGSTITSGGGGQAQTPWVSNIDGGGFQLTNVQTITIQKAANTAQITIDSSGNFLLSTSQPIVLAAKSYVLPNLPTTQPAAGSNQLWADPALSNTVKWEP